MDTLYLAEVFGLTNIFGCSLLAAASSKSLSLDQHLPFVKLKLQLDFINHVACKLLLTAELVLCLGLLFGSAQNEAMLIGE